MTRPITIPGARNRILMGENKTKTKTKTENKLPFFNKDQKTVSIIPEGGGVFFMEVPIHALDDAEKAEYLPTPKNPTSNNSGKCLFPNTGLFRP